MKSIRTRIAAVFAGAIVATCLSTAAVDAQAYNVSLVGRFTPESTTTMTYPTIVYNDLWGYLSPAGGEYIVMGTTGGSYIVDATSPSQPTSLAYFDHSAGNSGWSISSWRDMKCFGTHAYIVTEGGGGMQIIDLTNPQSPQLVKTWGTGTWTNAHNIAMDMGTGVAYVCGTRGGIFAIDVKTDPINPSVIGQFRTPYVHDLHVQNGYGYFSDQNNNRMLIVDVTALPAFTTLGRATLPGTRISHNAWATEDDDYAVTTNERAGEPVGVFDIRNKANPQLVASYRTGPSSTIPHNAYIKDGIAHISYYTEGYRIVDLSDPANPTEVGYYDTWAGQSSSFNGAWACYPFQPSGNVYINDIQSGLYVLKPKATSARYGTATAGTNRPAPLIRHWGAAWLGNTKYQLRLAGGTPNTVAWFAIGFGSANANVGGLTLNVNLFAPQAAIIPTTTDAQGKASLPIGIPNIPAIDGTMVYVQAFVADPTAPIGLAATRGMRFELFAK